MIGRCWRRSCSWPRRVARGSSCRPRPSARQEGPLTGALPSGRRSGCGPSFSPGPRRARRPRRARLVPLRDRLGEHAGPEKGVPDWSESCRPGQVRLEGPLDYGADWSAPVCRNFGSAPARQPGANPAGRAYHRSVLGADAVGADREESSTPTRGTTTTTCRIGYAAAPSGTASPARASSPRPVWAATAGP